MGRHYYTGSRTEAELASMLTKKMRELADTYMDGNASAGNKAAIRSFMDRVTRAGLPILEDALRDIINGIDEIRSKYEPLVASVRDLQFQEQSLMKKVTALKMEKREQEDKFTDPKAREAFRLYTEVINTGQRDNGYERCRRITAAGAMAAAFLGLTRYGGGNNDGETEES